MEIDLWEQATRLGAAALAAGAIGLERELRDKAAGLKTHLLVALGAATFMLISEIGLAAPVEGEPPNLDRMRALAGLIGGIGFLGAGAIIRDRGGIRGLTTAASLWTAAAIGSACGFGYYGTAFLLAGIALVVLVPIDFIERRVINPNSRQGAAEPPPDADGDEAAPNPMTTRPPTSP